MNDCEMKLDLTRQMAALYDVEDLIDCKGERMNTTGLEERAIRTYAACSLWTYHKHVHKFNILENIILVKIFKKYIIVVKIFEKE